MSPGPSLRTQPSRKPSRPGRAEPIFGGSSSLMNAKGSMQHSLGSWQRRPRRSASGGMHCRRFLMMLSRSDRFAVRRLADRERSRSCQILVSLPLGGAGNVSPARALVRNNLLLLLLDDDGAQPSSTAAATIVEHLSRPPRGGGFLTEGKLWTSQIASRIHYANGSHHMEPPPASALFLFPVDIVP